MIFQIPDKSLIKNRYIFQFHLKQCSVTGILDHLLDLTVPDIVLHKLRQNGLHFIQISRLTHLASQVGKLLSMLLDHLLEHHTLTCFFQKRTAVSTNFLQHAICQTLKT